MEERGRRSWQGEVRQREVVGKTGDVGGYVYMYSPCCKKYRYAQAGLTRSQLINHSTWHLECPSESTRALLCGDMLLVVAPRVEFGGTTLCCDAICCTELSPTNVPT